MTTGGGLHQRHPLGFQVAPGPALASGGVRLGSAENPLLLNITPATTASGGPSKPTSQAPGGPVVSVDTTATATNKSSSMFGAAWGALHRLCKGLCQFVTLLLNPVPFFPSPYPPAAKWRGPKFMQPVVEIVQRSLQRRKLNADFLREIRMVTKLRHPCITTVMGATYGKGIEPLLIMELMDRGSLYDLLHNPSVMLEADALMGLLRDISAGMTFLHMADPPVLHNGGWRSRTGPRRWQKHHPDRCPLPACRPQGPERPGRRQLPRQGGRLWPVGQEAGHWRRRHPLLDEPRSSPRGGVLDGIGRVSAPAAEPLCSFVYASGVCVAAVNPCAPSCVFVLFRVGCLAAVNRAPPAAGPDRSPPLPAEPPAASRPHSYSFGITMYEILTRSEPYEGEDPFEVLRAVADDTLDPPKRPKLPDACPPVLRDLYYECVHKNPDRRPNFQEIRDRLEKVDPALLLPMMPGPSALRTEQLLEDIFPPKIAKVLREGRTVEPESVDNVCIFFSDVVGCGGCVGLGPWSWRPISTPCCVRNVHHRYTNISSQLKPNQVMDMLNRLYKCVPEALYTFVPHPVRQTAKNKPCAGRSTSWRSSTAFSRSRPSATRSCAARATPTRSPTLSPGWPASRSTRSTPPTRS